MKRLLPLLALAALVAVPAAGASRHAPPVLHAGKLVVAFGDPAPGFATGTVRGNTVTKPRGYEVDLAKAIAKQLHLTPVWMYSPWNSLFAPGTKKFDISFQEATITAQRKRTVDFTDVVPEREPGRAALEDRRRRRTASPTCGPCRPAPRRTRPACSTSRTS